MKKIIKGIIGACLIGVLGWNTYSLYNIKEQIKDQDIRYLKEQNDEEYIPEEYIPEERDGIGPGSMKKKKQPYLLFLNN